MKRVRLVPAVALLALSPLVLAALRLGRLVVLEQRRLRSAAGLSGTDRQSLRAPERRPVGCSFGRAQGQRHRQALRRPRGHAGRLRRRSGWPRRRCRTRRRPHRAGHQEL